MKNKLFLLFFIVLLIPIAYATTSSSLNVGLGISVNTAPTIPVLVSVNNNSNITTSYVILDWNNSIDAQNQTITYYIYADQINANTLIANTTSSSYIWNNLNTLGDYYWKIVASDGSLTNTSEIWHFVRSQSVGGGVSVGGGNPLPQFSQTWTIVTPPQNITMSFIPLDITDINIQINKPLYNVKFEIYDVTSSSAVPTLMMGNTYRYYDIKKYNINNADIVTATIKFRMPKTFMNQNNIDKNQVKLDRYDNGWTVLPTTVLYEDSTYVYYQAVTSGFSYFAINGNNKAVTNDLRFEIQNLKQYYKQNDTLKFNVLVYKNNVLYDPESATINLKNPSNEIIETQTMKRLDVGIYEVNVDMVNYDLGVYTLVPIIGDKGQVVTQTNQFTITGSASLLNAMATENGQFSETTMIIFMVIGGIVIISLLAFMFSKINGK